MANLVYAKKRLEPIIKKFGIDVDNDVTFKAIITLFNGQTDYQIWALKVFHDSSVSIDQLKLIQEWANTNPTEISHLSKHNIVSYKTPSDIAMLFSEIGSLDAMHMVTKFIAKFNTEQRQILKNTLINDVVIYNCLNYPAFNNFFKLVKDFETLPQHRQQKFISLMSAVYSFDEIIVHLHRALEESYTWNREDMLSFAQRNCKDTEVCFDKDNVVILRVPTYESSTKLCGGGRTSWCLTRDRSYFTRYTKENDNAQQFFLFDFNKAENHDLSHVGFSVNPNRGINYAHSTRNGNLMSELEVNGEKWDIHKVLETLHIDKSAYIRLKKLKNYAWDKLNFCTSFSSKVNNIKELEDGRIIVSLGDNKTLRGIIDHTLIQHDFDFRSSSIFAVLDFSKDVNDENALLIVVFVKDKYETLSFKHIFNAYNQKYDKTNTLKHFSLTSDMFVNNIITNPNILLHKLIDEHNTEEAVKLLKENKDVDPNFVFFASMPAIKAITIGDANLFKAITAHPKFNINLTDGFGEPYSHFLLIMMETQINSKKNMSAWMEMCLTVLENKDYDVNRLNLNDDTTLHCACEHPAFVPIVEYLINRDDVDINKVNDWGFRPIDVALDCEKVNVEAIKLLLTRQDLIISDDTQAMCKAKGVDLEKLKASIQASSTKQQNDSQYAEIFAKVIKKS